MANMLENKAQLNTNNTTMREQLLSMVRELPQYVEPVEYNEYSGDNPLTINEEGASIPANTLLTSVLQIVNGVEGGINLSELFGYEKMAIDKFIYSSNTTSYDLVLPHSLGEKPKYVLIVAPASNVRTTANAVLSGQIYNDIRAYTTVVFSEYLLIEYDGACITHDSHTNESTSLITASNVTINASTALYRGIFPAGVEYTLITFA